MIKKLLLFIYEYCIWMVSFWSKKDKNIWIFGAVRSQKYMDNAKYLFEYIHHETDIKAIWISKNHDIVESLRLAGFNALYEYTFDAVYHARNASVAIITHRGNRNNADLPFYAFSKETKIIQLWHGIPLKKIAYDDKIFSFDHNEDTVQWKLRVSFKNFFFPFLNYVNNPSLILALSDETRDIFSKAFRVSKEKVQITGYPRNDILLQNISVKNKENKKVIYMPTFRGDVDSDFDIFLQYRFDVDKLDDFLSAQNIQLYIKLHPFNHPSVELMERLEQAKNIFFLKEDNIYEMISEFDMLITDYSSIYFDYLLLDRPIIFAPFDEETYLKKDRELYFYYGEVTPGPKAMNWDEVMNCVKIFNEDPDRYADERKVIKDRFHDYQDGNSTKRVYEAILDIANQ